MIIILDIWGTAMLIWSEENNIIVQIGHEDLDAETERHAHSLCSYLKVADNESTHFIFTVDNFNEFSRLMDLYDKDGELIQYDH